MASDPYSNPDVQSEATVQAMITRLEERGNHPEFQRMIADYVSTIKIDEPINALDLGCGTGVVARFLEEKIHAQSTVHGVDVSQYLLDAAKKINPASQIKWQKVEVGANLPFGDGTFDVIIMHTLLSHVPDTSAMLQEATRVLKSAGQLIVFDADHAGTTFGLPDLARMNEVNQRLSAAIACHPDICRQLPRHLKTAGLQLDSHRCPRSRIGSNGVLSHPH